MDYLFWFLDFFSGSFTASRIVVSFGLLLCLLDFFTEIYILVAFIVYIFVWLVNVVVVCWCLFGQIKENGLKGGVCYVGFSNFLLFIYLFV